ncbi:MAG: isoprenyl transferase [Legionellaceae bacterium]|nr:isoprenyl transferase [Legionellaceae bacterium]
MNASLPQHIAIIMDGNGRWARERGLERIEGHVAGVEAAKKVVQACLDSAIPVVSLFAFSSENWMRPQGEVDFLMQLFIKALEKETETIHGQNVRIKFIGDRAGLSPVLVERMQRAEDLTQQNQRLTLNLVINYGGRWDIVHAAKRLAQQVQDGMLSLNDIDEALFSSHLSTADVPDPDLLIRSSGEQRISNFYLWQMAYTELYFTEVYWPDFSVEHFKQALECFQQRQRRYGLVGESDV